MQNSPFITDETAKRLCYIVTEAHKREIKVIPYFGYEISTFSPYWRTMGKKVMTKGGERGYEWIWYRYPYQRDVKVCYTSEWRNVFADGIEKLIDEFDG